ncbi:MAG: tellurium resistance protein TerC [Pseudonocardiales bacterium]|nr:MAG: tellurium resistance protein TerC [Pseudonocardiales bacterium]
MTIHPYVWVVTIAVLVAVLAFDVFVIGRRPHEPSLRECGIAIAVYIGLAVVFGVGIALIAGGVHAKEFFAGWITEYSLSIDNLFIFVVIMGRFRVPRAYQQTALLVGIILALVLRGIFIAIGAAAIAAFSWVFYIFGGFLVYTAIQLARSGDHEDSEDNALMRWVTRRLPATEEFNGVHLTTTQGSRRLATPMLFVILALGTTDLLFALDSIPAIYGLTKAPYLVFAANMFALMGLRQLYFLIGGLLDRLVYLSVGLAVVLGFIGIKLIFEALAGSGVGWAPHLGIELSLGVIIGVLAVTALASLVKVRRDPDAVKSHRPPGS